MLPQSSSRTCTHEVVDVPFLPLEEVPSLPTAQVQHGGPGREVGTQQHTLHPVVEVAHVEDGALK